MVAMRTEHVTVAILTDGEENSSIRNTWHDVSKRSKRHTGIYSWEFHFLGAGQHAAMASFSRKSLGTLAKNPTTPPPSNLPTSGASAG